VKIALTVMTFEHENELLKLFTWCKGPSSQIPRFCEHIQKVPIKSGIGRRGTCFREVGGGVAWSQTEVRTPTRLGFFPFIPKFALNGKKTQLDYLSPSNLP
jgi:hypothetical protein